MNRARIEENLFKGLMLISTVTILTCLLLILGTIIVKGLPAMNWAMVSQIPKGGFYLGKEGGILNAILGSLYLATISTVLSILISLPVVLYLNVYAKKGSRLAYFSRFSFDVLWGIPSIVYGAFGFTIMLYLGLRASLLGGIIAVTFLIFPIMSRAIDEVMRMIPAELLEASYALGATRLETAFKIVIRQSLPGILTAVLIAFGRGIGDAASVIFTAGFTDYIPYSLFRPAATLPLAIFFQLNTPIPEVQERAYASAFILTLIILLVSLSCRFLTKRFTKHLIK
ncbi:MAG: phosphate ABC transporter permease PstA [Candidatus Omnitrophica bacterium]|nr:phosphate ABC transporter permease PstA [Candidatus Omnitrophota bacterium]